MEKRYQVFVSSTYTDLQEERQEVMHALLELDCIPAGMELFPAADEDQWTLIKRVIDDCDYYVVIVAGRYGSLGPDGMSYTEKEYRYALGRGKPTIAFLHKNPSDLAVSKSEQLPDMRRRLGEFRELLQQKMCKHWTSGADLGSVVSRSLVQLIKRSPAVGWVRADALPDEETMGEIVRLGKRVEELEAELARARTTPPEGTDRLGHGQDPVAITFSFKAGDYDYESSSDLEHTRQFNSTWDEVFSAVAPLMIGEASEWDLRVALDSFLELGSRHGLEKDRRFQGLHVRSFKISPQHFQTIKVQLRALGLIARSTRQHSVTDTRTYWTLTPYGDNLMTKLRAVPKAP